MHIGELAHRLDISTKTIRYYESIRLLPDPRRTSSGYRDYGATDVDQLAFIKTAQLLAMSLDEIREILSFRDRGQPPCGYVRGVLNHQVSEIDQRIAELVGLREQLVTLQARTQQLPTVETGCYCSIIEHASPPRLAAQAGGGLPRLSRPPRRDPR